MLEKTIDESRASISQFMLPNMANPLGSIHGGETMKMMDNTAAVCAMRHSNSLVVTISVDQLDFYVPIYSGELVVCEAALTYVGRSSMEIEVVVSAENLLLKKKRTALVGYFTMIGVNEKFEPIEVPRLKLQNDDEVRRFNVGQARAEARREAAMERSRVFRTQSDETEK